MSLDNRPISFVSAAATTLAGSYLAALVIYERLYGHSPVGLPSKLKLRSGAEIKLPEDQARLLQAAAAEANKKFG